MSLVLNQNAEKTLNFAMKGFFLALFLMLAVAFGAEVSVHRM